MLLVGCRSGRAGLLALPLLALLASPRPLQAAAATEADMLLYTRIAALNVCVALVAEVPFDKAVVIAGETIARVIRGEHDSAIEQLGGQPLSLDELRRGSINSAVLGAAEVCPDQLPESVRRDVEAAVQRVTGSEAIPPPPQPATLPPGDAAN
ncbi:cAMP phosphodiesterase [Cyanobium sp. NS01]|uniref:cAMP phosphodiesterase n=2 Tax=unclassified Cyanobium TaxID=2627006 RepID=UPI0018627BFC|nr:cAMP phosphodiesterase [Cyanobium sp. NS01]QNI71192.1 putative cAMP phosphodiesterase class-II [Cyanobium sp. NS01]